MATSKLATSKLATTQLATSKSAEPNTPRPALVMGANGFMGSHIVRALKAQGRPVRAMVRASSDTSSLDGLDIEFCYGDLHDETSIRAAMAGCGSVFYNVVDTRAWLVDPAPLYTTNVDLLSHVLDAAVTENVRKFVFTSSMVTLARNSGSPVREDAPFDWWQTAPHYVKTRVLAEQAVMEACKLRNLDAVVLCIANTYGPADHGPTPHGQVLWRAASGQGVALDCSIPTVDVRDAATAALLAERLGRSGERYAIANEQAQQIDFYSMASAIAGTPAPRIISMKKAYFFATLADLMNRVRGVEDAKFCRSSVFLSEAFGPIDHAKATRELGWQPRPLSQTVADAIAWYRENEMRRRDRADP